MNNIRKYKDVFKNLDITPNKIEYRGKTVIVDTNKGIFVLKQNNQKNKNIYEYLSNRHFNYYPKIRNYKEFEISEYSDEISIPKEQKIIDLIELMALLHSKTTHYKEVTEDDYKEIYEDVLSNIEHLETYYLDIINIIESKIFMSPSEYLIARNISKILAALYYSKQELNRWYELVKEKKKIRNVCIHNNLSLEHFIEGENTYFISWDKSKISLPIFDFYKLYKQHGLEFDFYNLLSIYEKKYPLLKEERILLFILMSIPDKVPYIDSEYSKCKKTSENIDLIYKTEYIISPYNSKEGEKN